MTVKNIQLNALMTAVDKLEALKAKTTRTTAYASPKQQANDYEYMAGIADKAKSIIDDLLVDMVFACFDAMGADMPKGTEEALTNNEALEDALAYAEDIADEYRFGGAA